MMRITILFFILFIFVVQSAPCQESECSLPDSVKIFKTEYKGQVFYKLSDSDYIHNSLASAQFFAEIATQAHEDAYSLCKKTEQEKIRDEFRKSARENADKNNLWEEVK